MTILILCLQIFTLFLVCYLWWLITKITNRIGFLNTSKLNSIAESGARLEAGAAVIAQDLSNAHARADAVEQGNHGEAADAASQQTPKERLYNHNPKF